MALGILKIKPRLQPASFLEIAPYRRAAARERVSVSVTGDTYWFLYVDGAGLMIGFCALMQLRTGTRIKGVWVLPELRGNGYGRQMTLDLIDYAVNYLRASRLEAYAHNSKFYEEMGWRRLGASLPNGAVRLARNY